MSMGSVERAVFPSLFCVLAGRARPATGAMVACPSAGRPGCFELKKNITLEVQAEVARKQGDRRGEANDVQESHRQWEAIKVAYWAGAGG